MAAPNAPAPSPQGSSAPAGRLIGGVYAVDMTRPLPGAGGGLGAFAAVDQTGGQGGMMAVQTRPGRPARALALNLLAAAPADGVLNPLAHGAAVEAGGAASWFVVCPEPKGPPLWSASAGPGRPWSEAELLDDLLRPGAHALEQLQERRLTHRAIRPDNLFRSGRRDPVVLGCAWASPPGSLQPAQFEPPYMAMCLPGGRGDGSIADDVYALGVTMLALALGRLPLAGLDDAAIIQRKLDLGCYAALVGDERLPPVIADLVRGMLAEDPEHRPPPALLFDPAAARARRVAARPPRRAQRPLEIAGQAVWSARTLAHAIATDPAECLVPLRTGGVDRWLRRNLGDSLLAARLDEVLRLRGGEDEDDRADAMLAMRAVAVLDPLAPLCWRGHALWPDGLGPALAAAPAGEADETQDALQQIVASEAVASWAMVRPDRCDATLLRLEGHQNRALLVQRGWAGGLPRLRYALNPLLACRSPLVEGFAVVRLPDLLPALEAVATRPERRKTTPVDREIVAFIAARYDFRIEADLTALADARLPHQVALAQLNLLAGLQARQSGVSVPRLAAWLGEQLTPALAVWRNRARRRQMEAALKELTATGQLTAMLAALADPPARAAEDRALRAAKMAVRQIDAQLAAIESGGSMRAETARRISQEVVAGAGALAVAAAFVAAVLS
jgi:hypothetical protein